MIKRLFLTVRKSIAYSALALSLLLLIPPTVVCADELESAVENVATEDTSESESESIADNSEYTSESESESIKDNSESESESIEDSTAEMPQNVQINIVTDESEITEETDEDGNVISYIISANTSSSDETQTTDLTKVETSLEKISLILEDILLVIYVIAFLLGGLIVYIFIHWSLNRKGVLG